MVTTTAVAVTMTGVPASSPASADTVQQQPAPVDRWKFNQASRPA
ncbi:hypothetical protein ACIG5E_29320 [Kitasatospora sp. NPDC053057]